MLKRKIYQQLADWKRVSNGRTAAFVEGARRTGKSTIVEAFARSEYADYLLLDFAKETADVKRLFVESVGDLDTLFRDLFLLKGKSLPAGNAVVILDEIQLHPPARQAIKVLVADGRYHYIETGSLLSVKNKAADILIPSEEHRIKMYPMDFEEFLWATGDSVTADAIRDAFDRKRPLGDAVHRKIMKSFRAYMAVGGMPQAVVAYVEGQTWDEIDFVKQTILSLYAEDLHKYDSEVNGKVSAVFATIPEQLSTRSRRFRYAAVDKNARYSRIIGALTFLKESMMVNVCENVTDPDVLMELYAESSNFKMYLGDTGLLVTQAMSGGRADADSLYKALIFDKLDSNLGMVVENAVAQMLAANGHALHFHEFEYGGKDGGRPRPYEIDFLLVRGKRLCPVEVKSSGYRTHKSLDAFFGKYDVKPNERYVLYMKDVDRKDGVAYLPLYMAMCL